MTNDRRGRSTFAVLISWMNSAFVLNFSNCLTSCSMASTGCIDVSVRRNIVTACNSSGCSSNSSRRVPDWLMSSAGQTRRSASLRSTAS